MAAHADDQADWLRSRQAEYKTWKAQHRPNTPSKTAEGHDAIAEIWDSPAAPKMMVIPAGKYVMGSPASEQGRKDNENQHQISIRYSFAVGNRQGQLRRLR